MSKKSSIGSIYEIRNIENNKRYIGSTVDTKGRKRLHFSLLQRGKHHSVVLQRAFNKYGKNSFFFSIIEENIPLDYLIEREQYWIDKLQPEYNILKFAGSNMGWNHSEETRARMSTVRKGRDVSPEWRKNISIAKKGKPVSSEVRKKISKALMGHTYTVTKPIQQIDPNTNEIIKTWISGALAAKELGISRGNLCSVVRGQRTFAGGFKWRYSDNGENAD